MSKANEPAHPAKFIGPGHYEGQTKEYYSSGLTKLEYFSGLAMQANLACPMSSDALAHFKNKPAQELYRTMAESSVLQARALLAELEKKS